MSLWTIIKLWFSKPTIINLESSTNNFSAWTADDMQVLMQLSADGMTDEEISIILDRSISAIQQKRRKLNLRK